MPDIIFRDDVSVDVIDYMGSDYSFSTAARVSTGSDKSRPDLAALTGLITHLVRNRHGSPFEHASITFRIEAPIFVFREFHRHRIGWSYNETSGRYQELAPVFYVPSDAACRGQVGKAANYTMTPLEVKAVKSTQSIIKREHHASYDAYQQLLGSGVARELARTVLPVGIYSSMYATCNPRSLMHFLSLRTQPVDGVSTFISKPQLEISMVADEMEGVFQHLFPVTYDAWNEAGRVAP